MVLANDTINLTLTATQSAQNVLPTGNVTENLQLALSTMSSEFNAGTPAMQSASLQLAETTNLTGVGLDTQNLNLNLAEVTPLNLSLPSFDFSHVWHF